jgi:hypothetical protein
MENIQSKLGFCGPFVPLFGFLQLESTILKVLDDK